MPGQRRVRLRRAPPASTRAACAAYPTALPGAGPSHLHVLPQLQPAAAELYGLHTRRHQQRRARGQVSDVAAEAGEVWVCGDGWMGVRWGGTPELLATTAGPDGHRQQRPQASQLGAQAWRPNTAGSANAVQPWRATCTHQCSKAMRAERESRSSKIFPIRTSPHGDRYCTPGTPRGAREGACFSADGGGGQGLPRKKARGSGKREGHGARQRAMNMQGHKEEHRQSHVLQRSPQRQCWCRVLLTCSRSRSSLLKG